MLTRLRVDGFKSLVNVDVRFGPFTCVAGANGVGKSNLFDAITFLADLADKPLMDAALSVRGERTKSTDVRSLFHLTGEHRSTEMTFEAEMVVPAAGVDDLGQQATATTTFLLYKLVLTYDAPELRVAHESLAHIKKNEVKARLGFPHANEFRDSLGIGRRTSEFISTDVDLNGQRIVKLHQDLGPGTGSGGGPRSVLAASLPRTVLSSTAATESRTALLARREMQSWRLLQLEPSALRSSDPYTAPARIDRHGAHMPATLARLTRLQPRAFVADGTERVDPGIAAAAIEMRIANRLAQLIDGVRSVTIDADDRRELLTVVVRDSEHTPCEARALSDGTLRFLALATIESDPEARGLLCLEEPENGIHPERIPAMLRLLQDIAVDPAEAIGPDNPLRQVIVNTHSPLVVAQLDDGCLLMARSEPCERDGRRFVRTSFRWLSDTWRAAAEPDQVTVSKGELLSYLNPLAQLDRPTVPADDGSGDYARPLRSRSRRTMDRPDLQPYLSIMVHEDSGE